MRTRKECETEKLRNVSIGSKALNQCEAVLKKRKRCKNAKHL